MSLKDYRSCLFENPLNWDAIATLEQNTNTFDEIFMEQKIAIETCTHAINLYRDV